jgi:polyhydroxyalkanoate synthase subunit PhaC
MATERGGAQVESAMDRTSKGLPGTGWLAAADPASLGGSVGKLVTGLARVPGEAGGIGVRYLRDVGQAGVASMLRAVGVTVDGPAERDRSDKRFADPAWEGNAALYLLRQQQLLLERYTAELVAAASMEEPTRRKAAFVVRQLVDAVAPTNFLPTNPTALKRAYDTGGLSLARGARNFVSDLVTNGGMPRQVVPGQFKVGKDLAATPGKVVFRNRLMELIQYAPQTETVHEVPLLLSPPWINKYYMMDLAPKRSLAEWAVQHGQTVFTISYRNPDETMRDVRLDDYLIEGPQVALDVIEDITGSPEANLLGLCLGGTLTMATLAYLNATGDRRVRTATLLNTLVDFSEPGQLGVFTDESTVARLEKQMAKTGFLKSENMRTTFDLLRSNDLIWGFAINNWLMGEQPAAFDLLAWNADSTRMPADMHAFYLRSCYLENQLARGVMELAGQRLDLTTLTQDLYFVSAEQDHIAPWRSVYAGARLSKGDVRFVLSNSGHIAGVVNPPNLKSRFYASPDGELPADAETWRQQAREHRSSWWEDWTPWLAGRSGGQRRPPEFGSEKYPVLTDAPGTYVFDK